MDYNTFYDLIVNSKREDWVFDAGSGRSTSRKDLAVSVYLPLDSSGREFREPWTDTFHDTATAMEYFLCYNGVPFERSLAVLVDGASVIMPVPNQLTINRTTYMLGKILNNFRLEYDQCLRRCKITVVD
jgi:hypothetical protein